MKRKQLFVVLSVAMLIGSIIALLLPSWIAEPIHYRCFTDVQEFSHLSAHMEKNLSAQEDPYWKGATYVSVYAADLSYRGQTYRVFAYTFEDAASAISYFNDLTGKQQEEEWNYFSSSGISQSQSIVYYQQHLYRVEGGARPRFAEFVNFVNADFSVDLQTMSRK